MANMDGLGPNGRGPMTGRGMGRCGRGQRRGFFGRFGFRRTITKEAEKAELKAEQEEINKRLKELEE